MDPKLLLTRAQVKSLVSSKPCFVYPWGCNPRAGFGANHSGLTNTLTMSISKGIGFKLVELKRPTGIAIFNGYTDFFLPFCGTATGLFLERLNQSPLPAQSRLPIIPAAVEWILQRTTRGNGDYFLFSKEKNIPCVGSQFQDIDFSLLRQAVAKALWE